MTEIDVRDCPDCERNGKQTKGKPPEAAVPRRGLRLLHAAAGVDVSGQERPAAKLHRWVKAPRSLFATFICSVCGRDSMVKHYGRCSGGR